MDIAPDPSPVTGLVYLASLDGGIPRADLRVACRLGLVPTDVCQRAIDVSAVRGSRLPAGRSLDADEFDALFKASAD